MLLPDSILVAALNLAIVTLVCGAITIAATACLKSLPKRHAILVVGLVACFVAPGIVGLGWTWSLGQLPALAALQESQSSAPIASTSTVAAEADGNELPSGQTQFQDGDSTTNAGPTQFQSSENRINPPVASRSTSPNAPASHVESALPIQSSNLTPTAAATSSLGTLRRIGSFLVIAWGVGAIVFLVLRLRDMLRCSRLIRSCSPNRDATIQRIFDEAVQQTGNPGPVRLVTSVRVPSPAVVGLTHPVVILPTDSLDIFTPSQLRSVLIHELSHISRKDHWIAGIQSAVLALYWWNPLVRIVSRQIAEIRELICDDVVTQSQSSPRDYAKSIVAMAERAVSGNPAIGSLGIGGASACDLERRIKRILVGKRPKLDVRLTRQSRIAFAAFSLLLTAGLAVAQIPMAASQAPIPMNASVNSIFQDDEKTDNRFGKPDEEEHSIKGQILTADGKPAANAIIRVKGFPLGEIDATLQADNMGEFEFKLRCRSAGLASTRISAELQDKTQLGFYQATSLDPEQFDQAIKIKLEELRIAQVHVVDSNGQNVVNANVVLQLGFPNTLGGFSTNKDGLVDIAVPKSRGIVSVIAWKDHEGLDYRMYSIGRKARSDLNAVAPKFPTDAPQRLVLAGANPLTVSITDRANQPIGHINIRPWLLKKAGAVDSVNLSFFPEFFTNTTAPTGKTTFQWMPKWQKTQLVLRPNTEGYDHPRCTYNPETGNGQLTIILNRLVPIRGQVLDIHGQPAPNIDVEAVGSGRSLESFSQSTRSDAQGNYELLVAPNKIYIVTAHAPNFVSATQTGFAVFPDQPVENRDFQLRNPTRVYGKLLNEKTREPISQQRVFIYHYGTAFSELPDVELPNPNNERMSVRPIIVHHRTMTNDQGEFEFYLGDGKFSIRPPQQEKAQQFKITGETEIEFTVTTNVHREVKLLGMIVRESDGKPLSGVTLTGVPRSLASSAWNATTDTDGKFKVLRRLEPTYVHALAKGIGLAAIVEIGARNRGYIIKLKRVGSASGKLVNKNFEPIAGQELRYAVDVPKDKGMFTPRFGGSVVTDANGEFDLTDLAPGWEYRISYPAFDGRVPFIAKLTVKPGEQIQLGDLTAPKK